MTAHHEIKVGGTAPFDDPRDPENNRPATPLQETILPATDAVKLEDGAAAETPAQIPVGGEGQPTPETHTSPLDGRTVFETGT